jgi:hypothetical protein
MPISSEQAQDQYKDKGLNALAMERDVAEDNGDEKNCGNMLGVTKD